MNYIDNYMKKPLKTPFIMCKANVLANPKSKHIERVYWTESEQTDRVQF